MRVKISKRYDDKRIFDGFEADITEGEILCVLGESGVGKTTLLHILARLIPFEGELIDVPKDVGYVFQEPRLIPHLTVEENLLYAGGKVQEIEAILQETGLLAHRNKRAELLSGGEKQRVNLVRAVLSGARLLLLDEPFSALDTGLKVKLINTFATLWERERPTAVLVTHDLEEAWSLGHRIILIRNGEIVFDERPNRTQFPSEYGENCEGKKRLLKAVLKGENGNERKE